jgi:hypothetical protein
MTAVTAQQLYNPTQQAQAGGAISRLTADEGGASPFTRAFIIT